MDLSYHVLVDLESGTFFCAADTYILDTRKIPDLDAFNEGSDSYRSDIAEEYGTDLEEWAPPADRRALDAIAALLNEEEWSSGHLSAVADIVRATSRTIADIP